MRSGYLELANNNPERFVVLDASKTAQELELEIWDNLDKKYGVGS